MAGVYVHIPFCKKKCQYCDFYTIGMSSKLGDFSKLLLKELEIRNNFLANEVVETIYFGGGTPSTLPSESVGEILNYIKESFSMSSNPEVTIEVNPDDLNSSILADYLNHGINRISIGVQSFNDDELKFLGRRHNAQKAIESIELIKDAGFSNISIDLIFGLPGSNELLWEKNLQTAVSLNPQHLSCYHLTFEEGTPFYRKLLKGELFQVNEQESIQQFNLLRKLTKEAGYIHYEVSNFARPDYFSKHNTSYWLGTPYLGVGPSAHSYKGNRRLWNPKSFEDWRKGILSNNLDIDGETLDKKNLFNELLLTRLRTFFGVNLKEVEKEFGNEYLNYLLQSSRKYVNNHQVIIVNDFIKIPDEHYFISDSIISDLILI